MTDLSETVVQNENIQEGKYLTFSLGTDVFGIEIKYVSEIICMQPITQIPNSMVFEKGIINLRGKIISVIDVRLLFSKNFLEYNNQTCIIILNINAKLIGLIVDNVQDIIFLQQDDIVEMAESNINSNNYFISAIGKVGNDIKLLLDCKRLVFYREAQNPQEKLVG